jgi:sulfur carrier protein ThiS
MKVTVKLIGPLMYDAGFSEKQVDVPAATTAEALLDMVRVSKSRPKIVTRNGKAVALTEPLEEGDRIAVSPLYSGG